MPWQPIPVSNDALVVRSGSYGCDNNNLWFFHYLILDSDRHWRLDSRVRIVILQREILKLEIEDILHRRIEPHRRQRARLARQLFARLLHVGRRQKGITKGVDEGA